MQLTKDRRVTGKIRDAIATGLGEDYENGISLRAAAKSIGRACEFLHRGGPR